MSPECQRCQTPHGGAARPSSKRHTRQVGPVAITVICINDDDDVDGDDNADDDDSDTRQVGPVAINVIR